MVAVFMFDIYLCIICVRKNFQTGFNFLQFKLDLFTFSRLAVYQITTISTHKYHLRIFEEQNCIGEEQLAYCVVVAVRTFSIFTGAGLNMIKLLIFVRNEKNTQILREKSMYISRDAHTKYELHVLMDHGLSCNFFPAIFNFYFNRVKQKVSNQYARVNKTSYA